MSWKKEIIDQPLHALWSGVSVFMIVAPLTFGWPLWLAVLSVVAGEASLAGLCFREWRQKRDKPGGIWHHWPWTDTSGYSAGLVAGILVAMCAASSANAESCPLRAPSTDPRVWMSPNEGSVDMLALFDQPDRWPTARRAVDVRSMVSSSHSIAQSER